MKKTVQITAILILMAFISQFSYSQPQIQWQKSLGGSSIDQVQSIAQTNDGGYIVAGLSSSKDGDVTGNHRNDDYWIVKLKPNGDIEWQKSYGGSLDDVATSIVQTKDGGYIVAGYSSSKDGDVTGNHRIDDYWIVKLKPNGDIEWQKSYGGSLDDVATSIAQTKDGGYIVAGISNSDNDGDVTDNHGGLDCWIVKLKSNGDIEWEKSYGGSNDDEAFSIAQTNDGGYIVAGYSDSHDGDVHGNHGGWDCWIVKLKSNGDIEWQKSYGGSNDDEAFSIAQTKDGGYIVAGISNSDNDGDVTDNHGGWDYWIVKLKSNGDIEWQKSLGGSLTDYAFSISPTNDGGYIVAGTSKSNDGDVTGNHGDLDYWIVKLKSNAEIEWQKSLGGSLTDYAHSISLTNDGGYIIAGSSSSRDGDVTGNHVYEDYWIVKLLEPDCKKASITITTTSDTICLGKLVSFNAVAVNGGNNPIYQWKLNGSDIGNNSSVFTASNLQDGDKVSCELISNAQPCVYNNPAISNTIVIKVLPSLSPDPNLGPDGFRPIGYQLHPNEVNINTADVNVNADHYDFTWQDGSKTPTYTINNICPYTYTIIAQNKINGCQNSSSAIFQGFEQSNHSYGGDLDEKAYATIRSFDNRGVFDGYVTVGYSTSYDDLPNKVNKGDINDHQGQRDLWVIKTDPHGNILWSKSYGGSGDEEGRSIIRTNDGYIVAGYTNSSVNGIPNGDVNNNYGSSDYWVLKLDFNGNLVWSKNYGGSGEEQANSIIETNDGYVVAGYSNSYDNEVIDHTNNVRNHGFGGKGVPFGKNPEPSDMWIIKIDKDDIKNTHQIISSRVLGGTKDEVANSVIEDRKGNYIITGSAQSNDENLLKKNHGDDQGTSDIWVVAIDQNFTSIWDKTYGTDKDESSQTILQPQGDNGYIIATNSTISQGTIPSLKTMGALKIRENGDIEWQKQYPGQGESGATSIIQTLDHGYAIGGYKAVEQPNGYDMDYDLLKLNEQGDIEWEKQIGGNGYEAASTIIEDQAGQYTIAGSSASTKGKDQIEITDHHGNPRDYNNQYWMAWDYWQVQFTTCPEIEVKQKSQKQSEAITSLQRENMLVYPNLTKGIFTINLPTGNNKALLEIYNATGIKILEQQKISSNQKIDLSYQAKGMYFIKITANNKTLTQKLVIE